ncbi:toxin-antitoxin system, toxin component, PIN family protein [Streptomyces sp. enrichment culture]|uniref:PIN-like domain-containing protein n=1 Tax=Streptomyces sp. enrichment culture TaxID=1795815 RepID=UPI003F5787F4
MTRSKPFSEQPRQPEFLVDRNLGKSVPKKLAELGWSIHLIAVEFPDDAQDIADEEWIAYGLSRGWHPLCKDGRIKARAHERQPLVDSAAVLFYLDNQQLSISEMVRRIHSAQSEIYRAASKKGPAAFAIGRDGVRRTWP